MSELGRLPDGTGPSAKTPDGVTAPVPDALPPSPQRVETCPCCQKPTVPIYGNEYSEPTMCGACENFLLDTLTTQYTTDDSERLRAALTQICAYTTEGREPYDIRWAIANSALNGRDVPDFLPSEFVKRGDIA